MDKVQLGKRVASTTHTATRKPQHLYYSPTTMAKDTITYTELEKLLTKLVNERAKIDEQNREQNMRKRLRECNKYYLPNHRYKMRKKDGKLYVTDAYGRWYGDVERCIRDIEKSIGL